MIDPYVQSNIFPASVCESVQFLIEHYEKTKDKQSTDKVVIKKGQTWRVRNALSVSVINSLILRTEEIADVNSLIVAFVNESYPYNPTVYKRSDIEFVELIKD